MATSFNDRRCPNCDSTLVHYWVDVEGKRYCESCHPFATDFSAQLEQYRERLSDFEHAASLYLHYTDTDDPGMAQVYEDDLRALVCERLKTLGRE